MTSSDQLTNRTRRGLPGRLSSPRNLVSGTTLSNWSTDATNFLHITKLGYILRKNSFAPLGPELVWTVLCWCPTRPVSSLGLGLTSGSFYRLICQKNVTLPKPYNKQDNAGHFRRA